MLNKPFHDIEHEAWSERAGFYDDLFADISTQAIAPILDSFGDLRGKRHLDVACGTGHLVAAASKRGAISEGVDFSRPMIDCAGKNYPDQRFKVADATRLPYDESSFDAVSCSFGLLHMENPQAAAEEAFRVLRVGGIFSFTLWFGADDGGELAAIGREAIATYATIPTEFPASWTQLRYADPAACETLMRQAGFNSPRFERLPIAAHVVQAQTAVDLLDKLSIRTRLILDNQPGAVRQRIVEYMISEVEARRVDGRITIGWPALLTVARKPE